MAKAYVKFDVPKELSDKILRTLEVVRNSGKTRKGINETTKAIERGNAILVVIAEDIDPEEIAMHLPILCEEKKIPFTYVPSKLELGRSVGIDVSSAAIAIVDVGDAKSAIEEIIKKVETLKKA